MMRRLVLLTCTVAAAPAFAQTPSLRLAATSAQTILEGCADYSAKKRQSHAIAVADLGGGLVAFLRMEGNGAGAGAFAIEKARAAASWGFPTSGMEAASRETPGFAQAPGVVTVAGGVPIYSADGKIMLGAVGVSGEAPADDEACAKAGIAAAGMKSERVR